MINPATIDKLKKVFAEQEKALARMEEAFSGVSDAYTRQRRLVRMWRAEFADLDHAMHDLKRAYVRLDKNLGAIDIKSVGVKSRELAQMMSDLETTVTTRRAA